jgi:hypothetical protein
VRIGVADQSRKFWAPGRASMRFDIRTKASPEQVLRAMTDFTDARLQI